MTSRAEQRYGFLTQHGCQRDQTRLIAGDASNRKYYRTQINGQSRILMDAPPEKGEDVRPFIEIATWLTQQGLSAPEIFAADNDLGFLIIEDLGDALFARALETNPNAELEYYQTAADVLHCIHDATPPKLEEYSPSLMAEMAALAMVWYRANVLGPCDASITAEFQRSVKAVLDPLDTTPKVLIQRDYHAENLLWLPERNGVRRVGLLDFQDAMLGHPMYDLVSVLQDARRDVSKGVQDAVFQSFLAARGNEPADQEAYHALGLQRNLRILGVFARLWVRDGKAGYIDLIPRVWGHINVNLARLENAALQKLCAELLPEPNDETLYTLKAART